MVMAAFSLPDEIHAPSCQCSYLSFSNLLGPLGHIWWPQFSQPFVTTILEYVSKEWAIVRSCNHYEVYFRTFCSAGMMLCEGWWLHGGHSVVVRTLSSQARGPGSNS